MKVAMLYAFWEGEPWSFPMSIKQEFLRRGHEVSDFNLYAHNGVTKQRGEIRQYSNEGLNDLIKFINQGSYIPDILLHMDYGVYDCAYMDKSNFPGVITICELGDTPQSLARSWSKGLRFDITITPDYQSTNVLKSQNINAYHWPHCADHHMFKPMPSEGIKYDCVTTCGPRGVGLTDTIKMALGDSFFNERYFWGDEYTKVLNRGKMVFQCSQFKEVTRRVFEGMACGKMVITDRLPNETKFSEMFIDGQDIIYYDSPGDAINKIKFYAANDEERERIARNGFNKFMVNHTVEKRVDSIFQYIEALNHDKLKTTSAS